jgi:transcriptional regulator with XRE-family HTH domain
MELLKKSRAYKNISQRNLASLAKISYKTLQLIESGAHDPKLSTLEAIATALGLPAHLIQKRVQSVFSLPEDSIAMISERIVEEGEASWKIWLFNFVDTLRSKRDGVLFEAPPSEELSPKIKALLASTLETLCAEMEISPPAWCDAVPPLGEPWFVSGVESLKASALVESPVHFRKRNIFVLNNFLSRA